jgi:hypothetical protein
MVEEGPMSDVFISYSADAKKWAEKLAGGLQAEGVATWSDFENISAGERIYDQLQRALDQATFYLIVVGPRQLMSDILGIEWQGVLERTWTDPSTRFMIFPAVKARERQIWPASICRWSLEWPWRAAICHAASQISTIGLCSYRPAIDIKPLFRISQVLIRQNTTDRCRAS